MSLKRQSAFTGRLERLRVFLYVINSMQHLQCVSLYSAFLSQNVVKVMYCEEEEEEEEEFELFLFTKRVNLTTRTV